MYNKMRSSHGDARRIQEISNIDVAHIDMEVLMFPEDSLANYRHGVESARRHPRPCLQVVHIHGLGFDCKPRDNLTFV